jgi:predicted amidohydrolase
MSQSPTTHTLPLPVTIDVTDRGVSIDAGTRTVAMSRFSARAQRLTVALGRGVHVIATDADAAALSDVTVYDVAEALS